MTAKRFNYHYDGFGAYYLCDKKEGTYEDSIIGEIWADKSDMTDLVDLLNKLSDKNEQLKKDNEWLFKCVENQSVLIQELDSAIMAYNMKHKITIKLTEKDLKTLDEALSYYTHQEVEK